MPQAPTRLGKEGQALSTPQLCPSSLPQDLDCGRAQRPCLQGGLGISGQCEAGHGVGPVSHMLGVSFPALRPTCSRLSRSPSEPLALGPVAAWMGLAQRQEGLLLETGTEFREKCAGRPESGTLAPSEPAPRAGRLPLRALSGDRQLADLGENLN